MDQQGTDPEATTRQPRLVPLFLASFVALFTELLLIRWLSSEIPVLGYFKNFPLLTVFVGLGVGCMLAQYRRRFWVSSLWVLAAVAATVASAEALGLNHLVFPETRIDIWNRVLRTDGASALLLSLKNLGVIFALLCACAWSFVGVGQAIGAWLRSAAPLAAYTTDILGSLIGVLAFALMSWLETPPSLWLAASAVLFFVVGRLWCTSRRASVWPALALAAVAFTLQVRANSASGLVTWSPYYRIEVQSARSGNLRYDRLFVNRDVHQVMVDLAAVDERSTPQAQSWRLQYDLPYLLKPAPQDVLIGGAGSGNDVAVALRLGAGSVTAVEIDPSILTIGQTLHPAQPYASPKVRVVNTDIRSFQRWSQEQFDLVQYGILDSHTALSSLSSLRLDNYVYTKESIRDALRHLKSDGIMCVSFYEASRDWLGKRMYRMIEESSGRPPISTKVGQVVFFIFGPGAEPGAIAQQLQKLGLPQLDSVYRNASVRISTDDWPYLYSNPQGQPWVYYASLLFIVLAGSAFTYTGLRLSRSDSGAGAAGVGLDWHMFFLGAAFLLVETKALAELSLLFGSTWVVNTFVFAGIFVMVLCANQLVMRRRSPSVRLTYVLLLASLLAWYFFPREALSSLTFAPRVLVGTSLTVLPLFFAGIIFATSFARRPQPNVAFGSNLIGAVVGGAAEAMSLAFGIRSLTLLAMALYALSGLALRGSVVSTRER